MMAKDGIRHDLRHATRDLHDRVDAVFSRFALDDRADYGRFLQAQAAAHLPIEAALDAEGSAAALFADWPERRRSAELRADLAEIGLDVPPLAEPPGIANAHAALGFIYVLEGSRLGGAFLRRSVPVGLPTAYLEPAPSSRWRDLLVVLEARLDTADARQTAIDAAYAAFDLFERSGRRFCKAA